MKSKILIVDDEENILFAFKTHFSGEGYEAHTVDNYESALRIISSGNDFDLIFVDIVLGGRSGIDILRAVKRSGMVCPVIIITGDPCIETSAVAVRLDAFDYIPKPVRKETLLRVARQALRHKVLVDEKDRMEAEKEKYRRNLETIFRSLKDAIITIDPQMRIIQTNEATAEICGFGKKEINGKKFQEIPKQCLKGCETVFRNTLASKKSVIENRLECGRANRQRQTVVLTCTPLMDHKEQFQGAVMVIRDITKLTDLEYELERLHRFHDLVGRTSEMLRIFQLVKQLADLETTVLVTGESGTGKELIVRALHHEGNRKEKSFVKVNCAALPENLLESELFGHVKGAFTGAVKDRIGRFQKADGGTLFLDEIGDVSPAVQAKLLRVLQEKEFEAIGSSKSVRVDVRLIAATNRDLKKRVRSGSFREDLYYRLKVVEIHVPPLMKRQEDIPLLINHFRIRLNEKYRRNIRCVSDGVIDMFMNYRWPGNVRELEHAVEHAFVLCKGETIELDHLPKELGKKRTGDESMKNRLKNHDSRQVLEALTRTGWNKAKAARILGISRPTLYKMIKEYEIADAPLSGRIDPMS